MKEVERETPPSPSLAIRVNISSRSEAGFGEEADLGENRI